MTLQITPADLSDPHLAALVERHVAFCDAASPPESCHRFTMDGLADPKVTLWVANLDGTIVGMGALAELDAVTGEVKSMHTTEAARRRGVGAAILEAILAEAQARGYRDLYLETGVQGEFAAARLLYERYGFVSCAPFASYTDDPNSAFYRLQLVTEVA